MYDDIPYIPDELLPPVHLSALLHTLHLLFDLVLASQRITEATADESVCQLAGHIQEPASVTRHLPKWNQHAEVGERDVLRLHEGDERGQVCGSRVVRARWLPSRSAVPRFDDAFQSAEVVVPERECLRIQHEQKGCFTADICDGRLYLVKCGAGRGEWFQPWVQGDGSCAWYAVELVVLETRWRL